MNLMKKAVWVVLAMAWLFAKVTRDFTVSFVDVMRYALGEDGEPVSVITFVICLAGSVVMVGFAAAMAAAIRVN